jgi:predicted N-acyltransferase
MEKCRRAGVELKVVKDFANLSGDLAVMWRNVYDRATEYRREILLEDFFRNMHDILGGRVAVVLAELGGKPIGFMLLFYDDETLIPIFCGLDYRYSKQYGIYFNLFYKTIEVAAEAGMKDIDLGITTLEAKLELGALPMRLNMYMKHRNPLLNALVPRLFSLMTPQPPRKVKHVFRSL